MNRLLLRLLLFAPLGVTAADEEADRFAWVQADARLGSSRADAIEFAGQRRGPDVERLRAYLREAPEQPELREVLARVHALHLDRNFRGVVELVAPLALGEETLLEARLWRLSAVANGFVGNAKEALRARRKWRAIAERLGWLRGQAEALEGEIRLLLPQLRYEEVAEASGRLADVERRRGRTKAMHAARVNQATARIELGRLRDAMTILPGSLEAATRSRWKAIEAPARDSLARVFWKQGDYAAALGELERARSLWAALDNAEGATTNAMMLGAIRQELGDFEAAARSFAGVQKRLGRGRTLLHADVKGNLGSVAWRSGRHEQALALLESARADFARLEDPTRHATACQEIGEVLIAIGRPKRALPHLERALTGFGDDPLAQGAVLAAQAEAYLRAGDADRAHTLVQKAFAIENAEQDRRARNRLHEVAARVLLARGEPTAAVASLRKALDLVDDVVAGLSDEQTFVAREQRARLFEVALECAFRAEDPDAILEFLERGRAAVLREAIGNRRSLHDAGLPEETVRVLREAEQEAVEARLILLRALKGKRRQPIIAARTGLDRAEEHLRSVSDRAEREHKRLAGVVRTPTIELRALQELLGDGDAFVYYALDGTSGHAFCVTRKQVRPVALGAADEIRALCERDTPVADLRRTLVAPLQLPAAVRRVLVCPDGLLSYLSWPEVLDDRYGSTLPSATTLALLREERAPTGAGVLAFGAPDYSAAAVNGAATRGFRLVPLPKSREEVEEIARHGERSRAFVGDQATEAAARAALAAKGRWRSVHFACHGIVDHRFPRRSALALTPDGDDDGFLTIPEILSLDVSADLVVLSACDSGGGAFVRGEGVVGLARAFLAAGAPRVLASLWKVDDAATKELMVRFYRLRREHKLPVARALRAAQRELAGTRKWAHPRFWAAWVLWGLP